MDKYIIYKKSVCRIIDKLDKYYNDIDYYLLSPISDNTLTIKIPVNNKDIRELISREEVEKLIENIPNIEPIIEKSIKLENIYKELLASNKHEDLIRVIKTTYLRNKERLDNNKKTTDKDSYYFNLAEEYLYNEFMIVLNMSYDDTKKYIIDRLERLTKWFMSILHMMDSDIKDIY